MRTIYISSTLIDLLFLGYRYLQLELFERAGVLIYTTQQDPVDRFAAAFVRVGVRTRREAESCPPDLVAHTPRGRRFRRALSSG